MILIGLYFFHFSCLNVKFNYLFSRLYRSAKYSFSNTNINKNGRCGIAILELLALLILKELAITSTTLPMRRFSETLVIGIAPLLIVYMLETHTRVADILI